jgi:hypothetical protein
LASKKLPDPSCRATDTTRTNWVRFSRNAPTVGWREENEWAVSRYLSQELLELIVGALLNLRYPIKLM